MTRPGNDGLTSDPLLATLSRLVEALEARYPDGPAAVERIRLAIEPDDGNMRTVSDDKGSPTA
jgi:hypothetical protein